MKRTFTLILALALSLTLMSCGSRDNMTELDNDSAGISAETESIDSAKTDSKALESNESDSTTGREKEAREMLKIEIGDQVLYAEFEDNSSSDALKEKLTEDVLTLDMHDYGNFEKVSELPWSLPRNDAQITTEPGDVILYQGNELTIYYDTNSWNFTRVARIKDMDGKNFKDILGDGNVTVRLSVE